MAELTINGDTALGTSLMQILLADDMEPGSEVSYQLAKTIYVAHPLGPKLAEKPIQKAQSQKREITIPNDVDDRVRTAFEREWKAIGADKLIFNTMRLSRIYGVASVAYGALDGKGKPISPAKPIPPDKFAGLEMYFNVLDPLNTAGSLVMDQNPNSPYFQKHIGISVAGIPYHPSRSCVMLNEEPIYISYTSSAFGFSGRSVYQRPLYPLKSYINSMLADNAIAEKLALLISKQKQPGSIVDKVMMGLSALKRQMLQGGKTGNVLTIGIDEDIETLNMMNVDGAGGYSRKNILHNIAAAASMPAMMVNDETFAEGFGEGSEDAKDVAEYINSIREGMAPLYDFFDFIVQYRAWNEEFYTALQAEFPEAFKGMPYNTAFQKWVNGFEAAWPSLLIEPESERSKAEKVTLDALIETTELLIGQVDPENKATLVGWLSDNLNEKKLLFSTPLVLDLQALAEYEPPVAEAGADDEPINEPKAKAGKR